MLIIIIAHLGMKGLWVIDFLHHTYFLHCKTTNMYRYFIRENNYRKG